MIAVAISLHLAPVSFDAGACSGGFKSHVINKYSDRFTGLASQVIGTIEPFAIVSSPEEISNNTWWDGRNIHTKLRLKNGNTPVVVSYQGKRYWVEKYDWKITHVNR